MWINFCDRQNGVWIGTDEGLSLFDDIDNWTVFSESNSELPVILLVVSQWMSQIIYGLEQMKVWQSLMVARNWTVYNESNSNLPLTGIIVLLLKIMEIYGLEVDGMNGYGGGVSVFNESVNCFDLKEMHK